MGWQILMELTRFSPESLVLSMPSYLVILQLVSVKAVSSNVYVGLCRPVAGSSEARNTSISTPAIQNLVMVVHSAVTIGCKSKDCACPAMTSV
jgi:hypothetical protein